MRNFRDISLFQRNFPPKVLKPFATSRLDPNIPNMAENVSHDSHFSDCVERNKLKLWSIFKFYAKIFLLHQIVEDSSLSRPHISREIYERGIE